MIDRRKYRHAHSHAHHHHSVLENGRIRFALWFLLLIILAAIRTHGELAALPGRSVETAVEIGAFGLFETLLRV